MDQALVIVLTAVSNDKDADFLSDVLIRSKYTACVNIIPNIKSKFIWDDKLQSTSEIILMIKTKKSYFKNIERLIKKNHSYKLPEIICINITDASVEYGKWISNNMM